MTENIIYQASRTVKKTRLPAGTVKKMSLAILVDQDLTWEPDKAGFKRVLSPPSPEKLKTIRDLVAGITGLNTERGDQLIVETLPFESTLAIDPPEKAKPAGPSKPPSPLKWPPDGQTLLVGGGVAIALIVLGFVAAMLLRGGKRKVTASADKALAAPAEAGHPGIEGAKVSLEKQFESKLAERDAMQQQLEAQALSALNLAPVITKTAEVLAKHLREKIKKEPDVSAQVLRTWIHDKDDA
jgi:flagellar M-ring protein FliF